MTKSNLIRTGATLALICTLAGPVVAGGLDEPVMAPELVTETTEQAASSGIQLLPRIIFMMMTLLALSS